MWADVIQIDPVAVFHGPNLHAAEPVVVLDIRLGEHDSQRLLAALSELQHLSGGWYRPLAPDAALPLVQQLGRFMADWSLQALNFVRGCLHSAGCTEGPTETSARLWVEFHDPVVSRDMLVLVTRWLVSLAQATGGGDCANALEQLWRRCRQRHPDYQASIVMQAARSRGIPFAPAWGLSRHWRFGQGSCSRVLFESGSCADGLLGARVAGSKAATKLTLQSLGLPTPAFRLAADEAQLRSSLEVVGYPCVTKPIDRSGGKGVSAGLTTWDQVLEGFRAARAHSHGPVMLEAHVKGDDHRLMVVDGRLVAAIRREAPSVRGDGVHTVRELVDLLNANRHAHGLASSGFRRPVRLDASAQVHLSGLGLTQESVLETGRSIRVRSNSNLSTGGECVDVTSRVHGQVRQYAEALAQTLNLPMLGLDYMTEDISGSPQGGGGHFVEINTTPGLDAMIAAGWTVEEAGNCALGQATGRIPVDVVVVADAHLPDFVRRMREHRWAPRIGWAASGCAAIGGLELQVISDHPWSGMRVLFGHRHLDHAVLVAGDRQVFGHGLPVDRCRNLWLCGDLPSRWQEALAMHALQLHAVRPHESVFMSDRWFRSIVHRQIEG